MKSLFPVDRPWPGWQKWLFRFIFIFLILVLDPLNWMEAFVPGSPVLNANDSLRTWAAEWANRNFFHIRPVLVPMMGSGDTSAAWATTWLALCVATLLSIVWTVLDRRRPNYETLGYWFRTFLRYYIITIALVYGFAKLFLGQMGTLSMTQMAIPVGQLSLMRICWYFMAASPPYQTFSGLMEIIVALLLLNRKTVTLGLLTGLAVFANVMLLNFSYDIPVKIFSAELVLCCVVLLFRDYERILAFLVLNSTAPPGRLYEPVNQSKRSRYIRYGLKIIFIIGVLIIPGWKLVQSELAGGGNNVAPLFRYGVYQVSRFELNQDSARRNSAARHAWTEMVFDKTGRGSLSGDSTLFKYRYGRSSFGFRPDPTAAHRVILQSGYSDNPADPTDSINFSYEPVGADKIRFRGKIRTDSVYIEAKLTDSVYPLEKWQFHWLQEYVP